MPYLNQSRKTWLEPITSRIPTVDLATPGDLNFLFCQLAKQYLKCKGESYQAYNDIVGALECAKIEYYRRRIAPYEDTKIKSNGEAL